MTSVFHFIFVFLCKIVLINGQNPRSPCPDIFRYQRNRWETTGLLTISSPTTTINIDVKLSVGTHISNSNGHLQLIQNTWDAACAALQRNGLQFKVHFPSQNPLPYVEEIRLNGHPICTGPRATGDFFTTFTLNFHLILDCPNFDPSHTELDHFPPVPTTSKPTAVFRKTIFNNNEVCGEHVNAVSLIISGKNTKANYPWLGQIYHDNIFICGGNLISNRHVVTAGHCITEVKGSGEPQKFEVIFGVHTFLDSLGKQTVSAKAERIHVHPLFVSASTSVANNDIAVIIITPVKFTEHVKPICLFDSLPDISTISNRFGKIAGWGRDEKGAISKILKETKIQIVSKDKCLKSNYQFKKIVTNKNFCAGGTNGSGPCNGDSGGGLFLLHENTGRWYLRGIISVSLSDSLSEKQICDVNNYAVYTDVAKYIRWFKEFVE